MRKHYILWQFKEETTPEQIATAFQKVATLRKSVPGLLHVLNGENASRRQGGYTHFTEMYFDSIESFDAYYQDESHRAVADNYTIPLTKRALTLDFDVDVSKSLEEPVGGTQR